MPNFAFGQLTEVTLDQKIENSTLIVEGKVVATKCYRNKNDEIYTANTIELNSILKGNYVQKTLVVTTWGGELDGELQTWTHLLTLEKGNYGLFFLEATRFEPLDAAQLSQTFDVYSGAQGLISFRQNESKAWVASDPFHFYKDIEAELYLYISEKTGQKMEKINENSAIKGSGLRYHFTDIAFSGSSVTFNVYVNSLVGTKNLYQSGIHLGYNPAFFGANIATNGNLQLTQAGISLSNAYNLSASNVGAAAVKIELLPVGTLSGYTLVGTSEQLLAKGKIVVQNPTAAPNISYNLAQMQSMSKYFEAGVAKSFDTVVVDGDWKVFNQFAPQIDSIRPLSLRAGTGDTLKIYGKNFGAGQLNSIVEFADARSGANGDWIAPLSEDYTSWSNELIKVIVPSVGVQNNATTNEHYAGTGIIRITVNGTTKNSGEKLNVKFAVDNITYKDGGTISRRKKAKHTGTFGEDNNGYSLYYTDGFKVLPGATSAFERALCTWVQSSNINFRVKDYNSINPTYQQYACSINLVDPLPNGVVATTRGVTSSNYTLGCLNGPNQVFLGLLKKFDIYFKKSIIWHTGIDTNTINWNTSADLETFVLHELGHAQLIEHNNQTFDVMYFNLPKYHRELNPNDNEAGQYIKNLNAEPLICNYSNLALLSDCTLVHSDEAAKKEIKIILYPNPTDNVLKIFFLQSEFIEIQRIEIFDFVGQQLIAINTKGMKPDDIDVSSLPAGNYYIRLFDKYFGETVLKFVKP